MEEGELLNELIRLQQEISIERNTAIKEMNRLEQIEKGAFEEVMCQVVEAKRMYSDREENKSTTIYVDSLLADFRNRNGKKKPLLILLLHPTRILRLTVQLRIK